MVNADYEDKEDTSLLPNDSDSPDLRKKKKAWNSIISAQLKQKELQVEKTSWSNNRSQFNHNPPVLQSTLIGEEVKHLLLSLSGALYCFLEIETTNKVPNLYSCFHNVMS